MADGRAGRMNGKLYFSEGASGDQQDITDSVTGDPFPSHAPVVFKVNGPNRVNVFTVICSSCTKDYETLDGASVFDGAVGWPCKFTPLGYQGRAKMRKQVIDWWLKGQNV